MTKWIIEAPVWEDDHLYIGKTFVGYALDAGEDCVACVDIGSVEERMYFPVLSEARAYVEAKAMEAMGAKPLPSDWLVTADELSNRVWNAAIEAAAVLIERNTIASTGDIVPRHEGDCMGVGYARAILALKRGGGNE